MVKKAWKFRPSPAMIVAVVALIAALGGTAVAGGVLNKKKVNTIISNRAPGLDVKSAKNADKLGNVAAGGYQQFCKPGTIKGSLVVDAAQVLALPSDGNFQNVTGFNCADPGNTTSSVQWRRTAAGGEIHVRFVPNPQSGSSVVSQHNYIHQINSQAVSNDTKAPGETVFQVVEADAAGNPIAAPPDGFSLVIF